MEQSLKICKEVKQSSIQVTYDLAIAKVALQIQATEAPKFDKLFIHIGPFHVMMSYFKAVGKFITDFGVSQCHSYVVDNNEIVSDVDGTLSCLEHEEADTKIVFHICNTDAQANFVIKCSDTDIAIIMLGHMHNLINDDSNVWLNAGTGNNQRYINLTKVYEHLGPSLSRSLPGFHALTGCDFNPAFFKRGKQRPLNILMKKPEYQQAFMQFGGPESFTKELIQENIFNTIQKFICEIYNGSGVLDVDAARLQLFFNNYSVNNFNEGFQSKKLKKI